MASSGTIRAKSELRDNGPLQIIVAVNAHRVGVHRPAIGNPRQRRHLPGHQLLRVLRCGLQRPLHDWIELADVEALARLDADFLHLRDDRLVGDMGRMKLEQLGGIGEIHARRHGIDLDLWRRLHVDAWVDLDLDRLRRFAKFGKQGDLVAGLDLVDRSRNPAGRPSWCGRSPRHKALALRSAGYPLEA